MALLIDTCNDIDKYEESVVAGLNAKKTLYAGIALLVGAGITLLLCLVLHLPIIISVYGATPASGLIIVMGFYNKDGMTFLQMMKNKFKKDKNKPVTYMSTETSTDYEIKSKAIAKSEENSEEEFERIKKLIIRGSVIAISALVLVIVLLVVLS